MGAHGLVGFFAVLCAACVGVQQAPPSNAAAVACTESDLAPAASREDRRQASLLFREGMAEISVCRYGDGIAKLEEARRLVPAHDVTYNIGRAYQEIGDRPNAIRAYREYLGTAPCDAAAVASVVAKLEDAEANRAAMSTPAPDLRACAHRLFQEGMIEIAAKRYDAGIVKLKEANDAVPAPNVLYNTSRAYRDEGDLEHSLDFLRKYVATNPSDRGEAEKEIGDIEGRISEKAGKGASWQ
jgi:tetratricopeptide (TPR) repeat protein